jgi:hypothetical protein
MKNSSQSNDAQNLGDNEESLPYVERPFPVEMSEDAFYGPIGKLVALIAPRVEPCRESILMQFLTAFANMIGRNPYIDLGDGGIQRLSIFLLIVGATAKSRKGPAWRIVKNVLKRIDSKWAIENTQTGLASGEALVECICDQDKKRKVEGTTDKRLLVMETEVSRLFTIMERGGSIMPDILRQAFDLNEELSNKSKTSPRKATEPHVGLLAHTTKEELCKTLKPIHHKNGFANRIMYIAVKRVREISRGKSVDWSKPEHLEIVEHFHQILAKFRSIPISVDLGETGILFTFNEDAGKMYDAFYHKVFNNDNTLLAREETFVARLSLLYAVADGETTIKVEHLKAAIAVWQYWTRTVEWIFGGGDYIGGYYTRKLVFYLRGRQANGAKKSEIFQEVFANNSERRIDMDMACHEALALGLVRMVTREPGKGRPAERWWAKGW